ncbi:hypothetical protein BS50DRAFT_539590 [Corynespora cassiicola Philippines]|uniref:Uncharacterized protein n=1 Tax=Corynespora cassiicola Philippines TaxID=1448308 RepID=A0A2T2P9N8_CORCC|nr:hypothetical protein BS50DRAFT_539590 [Corynespora cassiicola Philippines]
MVPSMDASLPLNPLRETYFRAIGNLLQGVPTSAWLSGSYMIMPSWPSNIQQPLGPRLGEAVQTWQFTTTVLTNELGCVPMNVTAHGSRIISGDYPLSGSNDTLHCSQQMMSLIMQSSDGCEYGLELEPSIMRILPQGGAQWTNLTHFFTSVTAENLLSGPQGDTVTWRHYMKSEEPPMNDPRYFFRSNSSAECDNREILFSTTPLVERVGLLPNPGSTCLNTTTPLQFLSNNTFQAHLCSSTPYMAHMPVTAAISSSGSEIVVDESIFKEKRQPVPSSLLNRTRLQDLYLHQDWASYLAQAYALTEGEFGGSASLLGALYGFNLTSVAHAPDLTDRAALIRNRFFGELLLHSFTNDQSTKEETITGTMITPKKRVLVISGVGIALAILFFLEFILVAVLILLTRPMHRPLQLATDPATTFGAARLINIGSSARNSLRDLSSGSPDEISNLKEKSYTMASGHLQQSRSSTEKIALCAYLACVLAGLITLYILARESRLYKSAFVWETNLPFFSSQISAFAPFSIVPTILAIGISLWWSSLDATLRRLQPYLAMSKEPLKPKDGVCLSYQSSYWAWAMVKALKHRHWMLVAITLGTTLSQIFVVSMSALFEKETTNVITSVPVERSLELRQVPNLLAVDLDWVAGATGAKQILGQAFRGVSSNWMYTATIQMSLNGSHPSWSRDEWSFIPLNISHVDDSINLQNTGKAQDRTNEFASLSAVNVSVKTTALRARLDCTAIPEATNVSYWATETNLTNSFQWNTTLNPTDWESGYKLDTLLFEPGNYNTTMTTHYGSPICCSNSSSTDEDPTVGLGYWSFAPGSKPGTLFPHAFQQWPFNFTSKWLHGEGRADYRLAYDPQFHPVRQNRSSHLIFKQPPEFQALTCKPVIESSESEVTVDKNTLQVLSYRILDDEPSPVDRAWTDPFVIHDWPSDSVKELYPNTTRNITTSYGVLFTAALLSSADLGALEGAQPFSHGTGDTSVEMIDDMTFNIRDSENGINADFMTYSMYSMAKKDPRALLDADTLIELTQGAFQTFFQHFVSNTVSLRDGGWAYQGIGTTMGDPGPVINFTESSDAEAMFLFRDNNLPPSYSNEYPVLDTERGTTAQVSKRVQVLRMNDVATFISAAVLVWLALTIVVVAAVQRIYLKSLQKSVDCLGDVLVWVAGSDNLLELTGRFDETELKRFESVRMHLGWFRDQRGVSRFGIEADGEGLRAVEWMPRVRKS